MYNDLNISLLKIIKDNKLFLVNAKTFICIEFKNKVEIKNNRLKGIVSNISHINYKPIDSQTNKYYQKVISRIINKVYITYRDSNNNEIILNNLDLTLYTPVYSFGTPVDICKIKIPPAEYTNLLIYFYELYSNEFNLDFSRKMLPGIKLINYTKSLNKLGLQYNTKKNSRYNLNLISSIFPMYEEYINPFKKSEKIMANIKENSTSTDKKSLEDIFNKIKNTMSDDMAIKVNNSLVRDIAYTESTNKSKCLCILFSSGWQIFTAAHMITSIKAIPKEITLL